MRIFVPTAIFHPDSGGPATYLYRFLPELQARGHEIRVLTFGKGRTDGYGYPVTRVSLEQGLFRRRREYLGHYRAELHSAEVIYINNLGLPRNGEKAFPRVLKVVGDYAWERAVNRGWVPADTDIDQFQRQRYNPLVEYLKWGRAQEVRHVHRVIVPSEYLRQMVIGWGALPERVQVIYNALESEHYHLDLTQDAARIQLGLPPGNKLLFTAARLTAWKGVDHLIRAVAQVPDIRLLIAGDGPQRQPLETLTAQLGVSGRIQFLGKVPHEQIGLYMRAADYFILYSGYEGLSHVLLEALSAGTPVIASARGGNPEVVTEHVNGFLVPHPDHNALVKVLSSVFEGDIRETLALNARSSLEKFAWPRLVSETVTALEGVYASASRRNRA